MSGRLAGFPGLWNLAVVGVDLESERRYLGVKAVLLNRRSSIKYVAYDAVIRE